MKFLCIADQQLGVASVTLESQEDVWDKAVTLAIENDVAGVLHAGDLFEHAIVEGQVLAAFRRPLARLREAGIPMLMIRGNHDGAARPVDALDVFHEYPGLTVSQRPELIVIGGANVVTLPWVSPKHLVAASNGASRENVYEAASEMLVGIARDLLNLAARDYREEADPIILLLHWSVSGSSLPTGLPVDQLHDVILPWPELDALGFDAVVCGHIHKPQGLSPLDSPALLSGEGTVGFYCGSPQPLNHGEAGLHGVWIVEPGEVTNFLPIESPRFVTLDAWHDWGSADIEAAIVRVRYTKTREEAATVDNEKIRRALLAAGASRVTIEPNIIREARARSEHLTETLTEVDALTAYCDAQDVEPGMRDRMIERTGEWIA